MVMKMTTNAFNQINTTSAPDGNGSVDIDNFAELKHSLSIMCLVFLSLIFVLGVLGNGVVIWVTGFKMKKTVNTVWYLNLAVADFLFAAYLPLTVTYKALGMHWPFGNVVCKLNITALFLHMFASVYILVVISVDRCVSVVWPVWAQNHRNVRKASCVSAGVWILALTLSAPYFFFVNTWKVSETEGKIICVKSYTIKTPSVNQPEKFQYQIIIITRFLLLFAVPFTVIVHCYAVIIHRLRRNRTLASQSRRPFKIIAAIIITFFLCWVPFHIMSLIELVNFTFPNITLQFIIDIGMPFATNLAFLNSCLNPLLYVFMGQDFKKEIHQPVLNWVKTAFQEEETRSQPDMKSVNTSQNKEKSDLNTEV
ncbi:chemokine-like receptor 1 [Archocentrus centrarchus]|uniref:chemokine-like receptor 1 n=1 Tax=Archocentrus centrarchus TaxID=63155 RepID=UPI0011EA43A5|nr:chemokine-like receptor 1 [Archocentrus centrarchus]